jgi:hypothetical protein
MATGTCPHCHGPVKKKEHPTLTQYHCAKCGIRASQDKPGVTEGVDPATYPARAQEAHEKYLKYENMVDQELRKLGQRLPQSWDAARMRQKLSSDAKYALALKYYDLSEKFSSLSIRYEELAKKRGMTESLLDEFVEGLDDNGTTKTHKGGIVTKTAHGIKHTKTNYQDGTPGQPGVKSSGKESRYRQTPILDKDDDLDEYQTNEASGCNHTMEGEMCPEHGLTECGMHESQVQESQEGAALLARIKSLALLR